MNEATIEEILQKIDQLPESDRLLLEKRLAEREEAEWRQAADEARQVAKQRGVDQAAVDEAVHRVRYSK